MRSRLLTLGFSLLCTFALSAQQRVTFSGTTPVGSTSAELSAPLTVATSGTIDKVQVLTEGSEHLDFTGTGTGTCAAGQTLQSGQNCTVGVTFQPRFPGVRRGAVVLLDRSGKLLATTFLTGTATGAIATFVPGTIYTIAGNQAWIFAGDGAPATQTSIFLPFGLAVNAAGDLFIADSSNNRIRKVSAATGTVSTIAGMGIVGATGDGGPATQAAINNPSSIALDPAGNVYFTDSGNNSVRRIDAFTGLLTTVAGSLGGHGYTGDGGPATSATLNVPNGIAFSPAGDLYIADTANHAIRVVSAATGIISTFAGTGTPSYAGDGKAATGAGLNSPWSVTVAPSGVIYIADQNNNRIRKVDLAGIITTVVGTGTPGFSGDNGVASLAQLDVPASVAVDVAGNLYIADSGNNRIRKVNAVTGVIKTVAGTTAESYAGDYGPADGASLYGPYTLALDGAGNLFIADVFHNRIREITSAGATLLYPDIRVNRVSAPQQQAVENDGNAPLVFNSFAAKTNAQFDPANTVCSTTAPLAPLESCAVSLAFAPVVTGVPVTGTAVIGSNAANSPGTVTVEGKVLNTDPTTLLLKSSVNPGATGAPITFSVTASSDGTIPTGPVTFFDGTIPLGTVPLQTGGIASLTVATMSGGQHTVTVAYPGDTSNSSAISAPLLEIVKDTQAPTLTVLTTSASPIAAGASLSLTATVNTRNPGAGLATIAGTVTFLDGTVKLGTATIDARTANIDQGVATLTLSSLPVGTHALTASYLGTTNDAPSTSVPVAQVVQMATTRLTLATTANPAVAGASLTLTASMLSTGGVPTGTITFLADGAPLGTATLNAQGVAVLALPSSTLVPGSHVLVATYAGDSFDAPSASGPITQLVELASTSLTLGSSLNPAGQGAAVVLTAAATSNGRTPTGTVQFFDGSASIGTATLNGAGVAQINTSTLALGTHTITVGYLGDTLDGSATSAPIHQVIEIATASVSLSSSKTPSLFNEFISITARVSGTGSAPVGTVTLKEGSSVLATLPMDPSGLATFSMANLAIGAHAITATYNGDVNHAAATSPTWHQDILQVTSTTLQGSAARAVAGLPVTFKIAVVGTSNQPVSGTVTLTDGASTVANLVPDAAGAVTYSANLAVGQHSLLASYSGDATNAASASAAVPLLEEIATTTTTLGTSANPAAAGSTLTLRAQVAGNGGTPGGSVVFLDGAVVLGTVPVVSGGAGMATATLALSTLAPGVHPLSARYSGDPNDQASQSPVLSQQIALRTSLALTSSANPALLTDTVVLSIAAGNGSANPPTGTVQLTDGGTPLATLPLVNGSATYTFAAPALGSHTLVANYSGDNENDPATTVPLVEVVTLRPSVTTLTASSTALSAGQQLILISVVQASGPRIASGQVTFQSGNTVLGTSPISSAGLATVTLNPAEAALNVVAVYSGDTLYAGSTSNAVPVTVGPPIAFNMTASPPSMSLQSGQRKVFSIAVNSAKTFQDTLSFGCAGLPADATCTFSTAQMKITPGMAQTLDVTVDTGNPLGAGASASLVETHEKTAPLLCLLPAGALFALVLRRRRWLLRGLTLTAMLVTLGLTLGMLTGCSSSFQQSTTPAGSYIFQIVATGNSTGSTQAAAIHLTVTK